MSGVVKAVGKVFKKVAKVVKKVALPALAIGAAVVTGGAALGPILGAKGLFAGGLAGVVGASGTLGSILGAAGTGALIGAGGSLLMGKNPIKGATAGLLTGAATGGLGAAFGGATQAAGGAADAATSAATKAGTAGKIASGGAIGAANPAAFSQPLSSGLQSAINAQTGAATAAGFDATLTGTGGNAAPVSQANEVAQTLKTQQLANAPRPPVDPNAVSNPGAGAGGGAGAAPRSGGLLSGVGNFLEKQPYLLPSLLQGVGGGLSSSAEWDARMEADRARQLEIENNYSTEGFYGANAANMEPPAPSYGAPIQRSRWSIDPITGKPFREVRA